MRSIGKYPRGIHKINILILLGHVSGSNQGMSISDIGTNRYFSFFRVFRYTACVEINLIQSGCNCSVHFCDCIHWSSLILYWSSKLIILLHIGYKFVWIYRSIEFGSSFAFHDNMPLIHQYNFSLWLLGPVALLFSFEMTWTHFHHIWLFYIIRIIHSYQVYSFFVRWWLVFCLSMFITVSIGFLEF